MLGSGSWDKANSRFGFPSTHVLVFQCVCTRFESVSQGETNNKHYGTLPLGDSPRMTPALGSLAFQETPLGQPHMLASCWLKVLEGPGQGRGAWCFHSQGMGAPAAGQVRRDGEVRKAHGDSRL